MRVLALGCLLLAGCATDPVTDGRSTLATAQACRPAPAVTGAPPEGAPALPAGLLLTETGRDVVSGRLPVPLDEAAAQVRAELEADGYVLTGEEDEGRAVRLKYFGVRGAGTVSLARLACPEGSTALTLRVTQRTG